MDSDITHRMMMLMLQLGAILFAARLGGIAARRARLPGVVGELIVGMLIGPYLLGGVALPGFAQGLFPPGDAFPVSTELYGICSLAAIVLLFTVGLETDMRLLARYSLAGGLVGVGGVVASFLLGLGVAVAISPMLFGQRLGPLAPPCMFLGIIATATSVGITARILSEKRKLDSPEGVTILAGAVVDDVLGIILLAVGLGIISASRASGRIDWVHIAVISVKAVGVWLAATALGLAASHRIGVLLKCFRDRSAIAILALGMALILAGLFEQVGLAMIIGAYVMGLSLSRTDINHVILERLAPVHDLLVPVFFTVMGMLVDLKLLFSPKVLVPGLLYMLTVNAAKIVGCGLPALFCGFNLRGALRIGCGMLPRGEVTLIIAGIGLAAGLLTAEVFGTVVIMLLLTALIAPPVLVAAFRNPAGGLRVPVPREDAAVSFSFPSPAAVALVVRKLLAAFESDGFYAHRLTPEGALYQLRKGDVVINFRRLDMDIEFECHRAEVPFVSTAMLEVLAELEQTVRELRKPIDRRAIASGVQEQVPGASRGTALARYVTRDVLVPSLKGGAKDEIIDELLGVLRRTGAVRDPDDARRAVLEREESMSTGMKFGVAIPHGRTDAVSRLVCAVGLKPDGVDFDSIDGQPSRIFVLTLSPRTAAAPHMEFMSMVGQALDERGRAALLACRNRREMYDLLVGRPTTPSAAEGNPKSG